MYYNHILLTHCCVGGIARYILYICINVYKYKYVFTIVYTYIYVHASGCAVSMCMLPGVLPALQWVYRV